MKNPTGKPEGPKTLTSEELAVVGSVRYADSYRQMADELLELRKENIPVINLLDVFADCEQTIYYDQIHCVRDPDGGSQGYRIMAERIAAHLGEAWHLRPKRQSKHE